MFSRRSVFRSSRRCTGGLLASVALYASSFPLTARAQSAEPIQLGTIDVVSPTGIATPESQTASSVTVLTADDLARDQRRTLTDALASAPGLNIVPQGPAGPTAIFMRGTGSQHVKVLIDGIDVSDPSAPQGAFDFAHLLTGDLERIEVLRGPQGGLYGSDAIGGVISITTKKGEGPPKIVATVEGGSFGTFNQSLGVSGSHDRFNYAFNVQHFQTASAPVTPPDLLVNPGQQRHNDYYDNKTYSARLGYDFNENLSVNAVARYTDSKYRFTNDGLDNPAFGPDIDQSTGYVHQTYARAEAVYSMFDGRFTNYFGLAYTNAWRRVIDPTFSDATTTGTNIGERIKADWRGVASIAEGQTLVLGAEDEHFKLTQPDAPVAGTTPSAKNANKAAYIELQSQFFKRLFVVSNLRVDDNDAFGSHLTYRVAPAFVTPLTETKLKASYGTAFKAPTLYELYVNVPGSFAQIANPNLKPETSTGYDFGFEQPLFDDRVRFGVTYFHNSIVDMIFGMFTPGTDGTGVSQYQNAEHVTTHGTESFISWAVNDRLTLRADYTYTAVRDDTGQQVNVLLRRPKIKESLTATWKATDQLDLSATVLHVGKWLDFPRYDPTGVFATTYTKPYTTVNLAANYKINDQVSAFGRIDNLFNVHYQDPLGWERPGFGIYGGLRFTMQ